MRQVSPDGMLKVNERCEPGEKRGTPSALQCCVRYCIYNSRRFCLLKTKKHMYRRASNARRERRDVIMGFKTDIEIAQECTMAPITEIAKKAGIDEKYLEQYGKYKAKIDYNLLKESDKKRRQAGSGDGHQSDSGRRRKDHHHRGIGGRPSEAWKERDGCAP